MTIVGSVVVRIMVNPKAGECCVVDKARLENLGPGSVVTWDASQVEANFKIVFPDDQIFGAELFYLNSGQVMEKTVSQAAQPGLTQDYTIFCLTTGKAVVNDGGISPTIIIGD